MKHFQVREKYMYNRSSHSLDQLLRILHQEFNQSRTTGSTEENLDKEQFISHDWIVINATSLGLKRMTHRHYSLNPRNLGKNRFFMI